MSYIIQEIESKHDTEIGKIIEMVGKEYGAIGDGFGPSDLEVKSMSQNYWDDDGGRYFVASIDGKLIGGGGIASFNGSRDICELRKLFLLPESRGLGVGRQLLGECLGYAKRRGYKQCYLDTLVSMKIAMALYESLGFQYLDEPLGGAIHTGCDVWMLKSL